MIFLESFFTLWKERWHNKVMVVILEKNNQNPWELRMHWSNMINLISDKISPTIDGVIYLHGVLTPSKRVRASPAYGVVKLVTYPTSSRAGTQQEFFYAFQQGLDLFNSEWIKTRTQLCSHCWSRGELSTRPCAMDAAPSSWDLAPLPCSEPGGLSCPTAAFSIQGCFAGKLQPCAATALCAKG